MRWITLCFLATSLAQGAEFSDGPLHAQLDVGATHLRCGESMAVTLTVNAPAALKLSLQPGDPDSEGLALMATRNEPARGLAGDRVTTVWHWTLSAGLPGTVTLPAFTIYGDGPNATYRLQTTPTQITIASVLVGTEPDSELRPLAPLRAAPRFTSTAAFCALILVVVGTLGSWIWRSFSRRRSPRATKLEPTAAKTLDALLRQVGEQGRIEAHQWQTLRRIIEQLPTDATAQEIGRQLDELRYATPTTARTEPAQLTKFGQLAHALRGLVGGGEP